MSVRLSLLSSQLVKRSSIRMMNTKSINRSGLTAEQSKSLTPRQAENADDKTVLANLKTMYGCDSGKLSESTYAIFAPNAVFHDPVGIATGVGQIKEQFNGLAKIFEKATIDKHNLLTNPSELPSTTLLVDQDVTYYRDASKSPTKTVNSLLTVERDSTGKVVRLQEEWNHAGEKDSSDGFLGTLSEWRKKATVAVSGAFVSQTPPADK